MQLKIDRYVPPRAVEDFEKMPPSEREVVLRGLGYAFTALVWGNTEYGGLVVKWLVCPDKQAQEMNSMAPGNRCELCGQHIWEMRNPWPHTSSGRSLYIHIGCEARVWREGWNGNAAVRRIYNMVVDTKYQEAQAR